MINVMDLIRLDKYTKTIKAPTLRLLTKSDKFLGAITNFTDWNVSIVGKGLDEISFNVHKYVDGVKCPIWDDLIDFKTVDVNGIARFEIQVDYADAEETIKSVHGVSLETELGQLTLNDFHVNDDDAMDLDDSLKTDNPNWDFREWKDPDKSEEEHSGLYIWHFVPTVFYRTDYNDAPELSDAYKQKYSPEKTSLLHRVLADKAPHWKIGKVCNYVTKDEDPKTVAQTVSTFQREYSVDGDTIYDFLNGEVSENTNVVFYFDTVNRTINVDSIIPCYNADGALLSYGIGEDTTILVSKTKLANEITISTNKDELKTCFKVEGGDDMINDMVRAVNMNGSNYIYHFADFMMNDMSDELKERLKEYSKYTDDNRKEYDELFNKYVQASKDFEYLLSGKMPGLKEIEGNKTAQEQWVKLWDDLPTVNVGGDKKRVVGVHDIATVKSDAFATATNNIEALANVYIDAGYTASVQLDNKSYDEKNQEWKGVIVVKRTIDGTVYPQLNAQGKYDDSAYWTFKVMDDSSSTDCVFTQQKLIKELARLNMSKVDSVDDLGDDPQEWYEYFRNNFCYTLLKSYVEGYESCKSILKRGVDDNPSSSDIPKSLLTTYTMRWNACSKAFKEVSVELYGENQDEPGGLLLAMQNASDNLSNFASQFNLQKYLGEKLYNEFCRYRRDDTYSNSNFVTTDIMDTTDLLNAAKELIADAEKELKKACTLQRTATVSLANLVAMEEFQPLLEDNNFDIWNYIRLRTDDEVIKLRIVGVDFNGDDWTTINVTFSDQIENVDGKLSDLESIIQQSSSISTSYNATMVQAEKGSNARNMFTEMYTYGLNATKVALANNDNNEVVINNNGITARRMDDEGIFGDKQLRITGNVMAFTDDAWNSVRMAIGETDIIDPTKPDAKPEKKYGVIADALVGKLIAGENMYIGNSKGSVIITGDGINITNGTITWGDGVNSPTAEDIKIKDGQTLSSALDTINEDIGKLDGRIQSYVQSTDPSSSWSDEEKKKHTDDLWLYTGITTSTYTNGCTYIYDGEKWNLTTDSKLQALAQSKAQIFTSEPKTPYYKGDMWVKGGNDGVWYCTTTKESGDYDSTHWSKSDTALNNFIDGAYKNDIDRIDGQLDKQLETYYQDTDPSSEWKTEKEKENHIGDLWYCTADIEDESKKIIFNKGQSYRWSGSSWGEMDVPESVYDKIDGKKTIYSSIPDLAEENDLLVPSEDITLDEKTYYAKKVYQYTQADNGNFYWKEIGLSVEAEHAVSSSYLTPAEKQNVINIFNGIKSDYENYKGVWTSTSIKNSYVYKCYAEGFWSVVPPKYLGIGDPDIEQCNVDDTYLDLTNGALYIYESNNKWNKITDKGTFSEQMKSAYMYLYTYLYGDSEASGILDRSNINETTTINKSEFEHRFNTYYQVKSALDALIQNENNITNENYNTFKQDVVGVLTGNPSTVISKDSIISPKIGGGYLYIASKDSDNKITSVEINPKAISGKDESGNNTSGKIINIISKDKNVMTFDQSGNLSITGEINATSGYIGNGVEGWTIRDKNIHNGTQSITSNVKGIYIGVDGIRNVCKDRIKHTTITDGKITSNYADITGKITATEGYIGNGESGWTIGNSSIYNGTVSSDSTNSGMYIGIDTIKNVGSQSQGSKFTKITEGYVYVGQGTENYGRFDHGIIDNSLKGVALMNYINGGGYVGLGHFNKTIPTLDYIIDSSKDVSEHTINGNVNINGAMNFSGGLTCGKSSDSLQRAIIARSSSGDIYLYANGTSTEYRGIYGHNSSGTAGAILTVNQNNKISAIAEVVGKINCSDIDGGAASFTSIQCLDTIRSTESPNCRFTTGTTKGLLREATGSSRRFKHDITNILSEDLDVNKLYDINVYQYKYNDNYLGIDDIRYNTDIIGFIAEDIYEKYPIAADYDKLENGEIVVKDWNVRFIVPAMLKLIQQQKEEIDTLKEQMSFYLMS